MNKKQVCWDAFEQRYYKERPNRDYVVSWHLKTMTGLPTQQINYYLDKFVDDGVLTKETDVYCTKYYLKDDEISK